MTPKGADEKIQRQRALLEGINSVLKGSLAAGSEEDIAKTCLRVAESLTDSKFGFINELDGQGLFATVAISDTGWEACGIEESKPLGALHDAELRGLFGAVLKSGESTTINDPSRHPDSIGVPEGHPPLISFLGVPLKQEEKTVGIIALANKEGGYTDADLQDIESLSVAFSEAISRRRAESDLQQSHKELEARVERRTQQLQKSKEATEALINATPDVVLLLDLKGRVEQINQGASKVLGKTRDELIGANIFDFFPPEVARTRRAQCEEVIRSGQPSHFHDEQRGVSFQNSVYPLSGPDGVERLAVYAKDITERHRAEAVLRESEERYRSLIESMRDAVAIYRTENEGEDFIFVDFNGAGEKIDKISKHDVIGKSVLELFPEIAELGLYDVFRRVWRTGESEHFPTAKYKDDRIEGWRNNFVYRLPSGEIVAIYSDQTEKKRVEQSLVESEQRFRSTFEQAAVGIGHVALDGSWLRVNRKLCDIVGYTADELMALTFQDITHPDDLDLDLRYVQQVLNGEIKTYSMEKRYIRKDGKLVWINLTVALVRKDSGDPNYFVSVVEDISWRKAAEDYLKQSDERYRDLYENAPDMYASVDADNARIIACNNTLSTVLGLPKSEIIGLPIFDLYHPNSRDAARLCFKQFAETGKVHGAELQLKRKDGSPLFVSLNASAVRGESGKILHSRSSWRDISERKRAERALEESERRYSRLVETMGEGLGTIEADGTITFANDKLCEMLGYTPEELIGLQVYELLDQEGAKVMQARTALSQTERAESYELTYTRKDGQKVHTITSPTPMSDSEGNIIGSSAVMTDITERKQTEAALRESRRDLDLRNRIAQIFLTGPREEVYDQVLQIALDATASKHGVFAYVDEDGALVCPSMTKDIWDQCQMLDKTVVFQRETWTGIWGKALTDKTTLVDNTTFPVPNGHIPVTRAMDVPILHEGEVIGNLLVGNKGNDYDETDRQVLQGIGDFLGPILKIRVLKEREETARKNAEKELRESEKEYRELFESSKDALFAITPQGKLIDANQAFFDLFGYSRDEATSINMRDLHCEPGDWNEAVRMLGREGYIKDLELRYRKKDGTPMDCLVTAVSHRDSDRAFARFEGSLRDITRRKKEEAFREKLIAELEDKNEELERFTYTVSHDLKSPLITIKTFCGFVEDAAKDGDVESLLQHTGRIGNAAKKMGALLDDLLTLSRIGRLDNPPAWVSFGELVQEALDLVAGSISLRRVAVHVNSDLPRVYVDRPRLVDALQNLIENAVKFVGEAPDPEVKIGARHENDETVFYVRDNGVGIDPKYHERVFRLFERLDPAVEGTGTGLAMVKRIVEVHGGRIWIESKGNGSGSTFCFTLPEKTDSDSEKGESARYE